MLDVWEDSEDGSWTGDHAHLYYNVFCGKKSGWCPFFKGLIFLFAYMCVSIGMCVSVHVGCREASKM